MNYSQINKLDIANGDGVRTSLFVSGCRNHCEGCFNKKTWDFHYGKKFTITTMNTLIECMKRQYIAGLSILGGEPFEPQNEQVLSYVLFLIKELYPHKSIWVWTGYLFEDLKDKDIMKYIDVLVDGPFIKQKKDLTLKFRGSSNQRLIDVQKSLETGNTEEFITFEKDGDFK